MTNLFKKSASKAFLIVTTIFTFVPEDFFANIEWGTKDIIEQCKPFSDIDPKIFNVIISRFVCLLIVWGFCALLYALFQKLRWWTTIKGSNYSIRIEYGDIHKKKNCKRVINFDECFTTSVGDRIADVKSGSICGQYLRLHPGIDVQALIAASDVKPAEYRSKYQHQICYTPGTIVPYGDDLLLAFAKLDERGKGRLTRDEYLECLDLMWKGIELTYAGKDVCIPVLGAGITYMEDGSGASIAQQDLLDMIIWSYKLCSHKIKSPHRLHIVCARNKDFSIFDIDRKNGT